MKTTKAARRIGKNILIIALVIVFLFAGMLAALAAIPFYPVVRAKQSDTAMAATFKRDAVDPNKATVTFNASFVPDAFRDIDRELQIVVTAADCVLTASQSDYQWTNASGVLETELFAANGTGLKSQAFQESDFYAGAIQQDDKTRKYITGTISVRITGKNPAVTVTVEDTDYPTSFPLDFKGYGDTYSVSRKNLSDSYWLYIFSRELNEFMGLIIDKADNSIDYICAQGTDANGDVVSVIPGNSIPDYLRNIFDNEPLSGWTTPRDFTDAIPISNRAFVPVGNAAEFTGNEMNSLDGAANFVIESGLGLLTDAFVWLPLDITLSLSPEALLGMCTVERSSYIASLVTPPPTGDSTPLAALLALSAVSMAGLYLLSRRSWRRARR